MIVITRIFRVLGTILKSLGIETWEEDHPDYNT